jgi:hypothetical protein
MKRKYFFRASNKYGGYFEGSIDATSERLFKQKFKKQFPLCKLWRFNSIPTDDKHETFINQQTKKNELF